MRIGLGQLNTTVGDLDGNKEKILASYKELCDGGAEIALFPELAICGYPPRDLIFKGDFVADVEKTLEEIAGSIGEVPALIGFVELNKETKKKSYYNAVAWVENGEIKHIGRKCLLPSYSVFEEERYFLPYTQPLVVEWKGLRIGVTICEDIWTDAYVPIHRNPDPDPIGYLEKQNLDYHLNVSASPWNYGKLEIRNQQVLDNAKRCNCPLIYCNMLGSNDELIFDGRSFVAMPDGKIHAQLKAYEEENRVIDVTEKTQELAEVKQLDVIADIHDALVMGLRDYARKCGFKMAVLGLSGGIDSAVVAVLAAKALGPKNVLGVALPSHFSSEHSKQDAMKLAQNLGISFKMINIEPTVSAAEKGLVSLFHGLARDATEENIQARVRGLILMAISNKFGALLLSTGNKSEMAVGYCTLYGDMAGGLCVISDLLKTKVYELAKFMNRDKEVIPNNTIIKEPSAELRPDQKDQDSLPPYDILDKIVGHYVEDAWGAKKIIKQGLDPDTVHRIIALIDHNEYKRKQAAPGLRVSPLAFGLGRRMPIVQKYKHK